MLTPKKKFTKKDLKHDPLIDTLEKSKAFYEENSKQITTGLVVGLIIVVLGWGWLNSRETTRDEAMYENTKATLAAVSGIDENVIVELERVVAEYGSNELIAQSALQLGIAKMDAGDNDGARKIFTQLSKSSDPYLKASGKLKLAYLLEKEANPADAAALYADVAGMNLGQVSEHANLQAGYAYVEAGNIPAAQKIVTELLDADPSGKFKEHLKYLEGKVLEK